MTMPPNADYGAPSRPRLLDLFCGAGGAWRNGSRPMLPSDRETWSREMGIDWMIPRELGIAIPPAYTEWIGAQLLDVLALSPNDGFVP